LHFAASHRSQKCAVALLEHNSDIDATDCIGRTPLIIAAKRGDGSLVELLLECGADYTVRDAGGRAALYHAVCSEDERSIRALL
ncbi:ankyrin, partial [Mytilinidion resinicola]